MIYEVNVEAFSQQDGLQLLNFIYKLGFYKLENGQNEYPCTTQMVDTVIQIMRSIIDDLKTFEKIDLGIALMIIPIPPAVELVNECLSDISEAEFRAARDKMIISTNYFESIVERTKTRLCISIIYEYLQGLNDMVTGKCFREKFLEITEQIFLDNYEDQPLVEDKKIKNTWSHIELTTCGLSGPYGPSLAQCISTYSTDWVQDPQIFAVDEERPGVQKITVTRSGYYVLSGTTKLYQNDVVHCAIGQTGNTRDLEVQKHF